MDDTSSPLTPPTPVDRDLGPVADQGESTAYGHPSLADGTTALGIVAAVLPGALYRIALANGHTVLAGLDPEARKRLVRLTPGDGVRVRLSPYDFTRGRIVGREPEPGGTPPQ